MLQPVVTVQLAFWTMFLAFCSVGPVQKTNVSSTNRPIRGVTCGRRSSRMVDSQ